MTITRRYLPPMLLAVAAAASIAAAPTAAAAPTPIQKSCVESGAGTTCQSPGNVEITNTPPAVSFYPYGNMPFLLGGN
jgi:hypothetical protein